MQGKTKQGFVLSMLLHVGVVVGAFLFTLLKPLEKPKMDIFELVAPPPSSPALPSTEPALDFSAPEEPAPPPPKVQPPPPKPKPPDPVPKPVDKPKPIPEPPKVPPPPPKPVEPPPKPMTMEEFRKLNPQKPKTPPKTPPKPVTVPRIDTRFTPNLKDTVVNTDSLAGLSQIQQSALQSYIARLRAALELCWAKPSGVSQTISTEIEFHVVPAGTLTRIRITRSSGNSQFDGSVLDAFEALGTGGQTPEGKPLNLRLTFRMNEL